MPLQCHISLGHLFDGRADWNLEEYLDVIDDAGSGRGVREPSGELEKEPEYCLFSGHRKDTTASRTHNEYYPAHVFLM